jgi:hypothetical protein
MAQLERRWYILVDGARQLVEGTSENVVNLTSSSSIRRFRDAVKDKCDREGNDLKGILSSKLLVYANKEAFERKDDPLLPENEIKSYGTKGSKLYVVVPSVTGAISPQILNISYNLLQLMLPNALTNAPTSLSDREQDFKHSLCQFYSCYGRKQKWIQCIVLNIPFPKSVVSAVHLFRRSNEYLLFPLMQIKDINNPKNGMLMFIPLKYAFDHFQISFIAGKKDCTSFTLKLFDHSIQNTPLIDFIKDSNQRQVLMDAISISNPKKRCKFDLQTTFGDIDGKTIVFSSPNRPFHRCLNLQARLANMIALKKRSIEDSYQFDDFWSEDRSLEDKIEIFRQSISEK